ncbi:MAG: hypothetical protein ABIS01_01955 [Ferruginibacter sp.]
MKTNIIVLLFFINVFSSCAFADNIFDVTQQAKESFKKQYPGALYAKWETLADGITYSVRFVHNNQTLVAYYEEDGSSIGFARVVSIDKLPLKVKAVIDSKFTDCKILSMQELILHDKHLFYFNVVNREEKWFIGINSNGKIRQKKKI